MPLLKWNPTDFLDFFGTIPKVDEDEVGHHYTIQQAPLRLELNVRQYDSDIFIELFCQPFSEPVLVSRLRGCPGVRLVRDKQGAFLEFAPADAFSGRYDGYSPIPYGLRLSISPQIRIEPFVRSA
jgi:hypothetical protein